MEHDASRMGDAIEVAMEKDAAAAPQQVRTSAAIKAPAPPRHRRLPSDGQLLSGVVRASSSTPSLSELTNAQLIAKMKAVKREHAAAKKVRDRAAVKRAARAYAQLQAERQRRKMALRGKDIAVSAISSV